MPQFIIGRQEGTRKLQIQGPNGFIDAIDSVGSVDDCVSRKHLRLDINPLTREMSVTNLNERNHTYVNGVEVLTKKITLEDVVELGERHYRVDMNALWEALPKSAAMGVTEELSIAHLQRVWESYSEKKRKFQVTQGRIRAVQGLTIVFTMGSALGGFLLSSDESHTLQMCCYGLAVFFAVVLAVVNWRSASGNIKKTELNDEYLREHYICPNKGCGRFLGYSKYKDLLKVGKCPYCGTNFRG